MRRSADRNQNPCLRSVSIVAVSPHSSGHRKVMEEIRFSRVLLLSAVGKRAFARIVALVLRLFRICAVRGSDGFFGAHTGFHAGFYTGFHARRGRIPVFGSHGISHAVSCGTFHAVSCGILCSGLHGSLSLFRRLLRAAAVLQALHAFAPGILQTALSVGCTSVDTSELAASMPYSGTLFFL